MKKCFTLLFLMINSFVFGQITEITLQEAKKPVQPWETILEQGKWSSHSEASESRILQNLKNNIEKKYPDRTVVIRNFVYRKQRVDFIESPTLFYHHYAFVEISPSLLVKHGLNKAFDKVLMNIMEGSRFSIDKVTVTGEIANEVNKETVTDNTIDILLDKGYKVVAKEYLERLYQEQQTQQSGIYNENTVVQENNLSAVGYFLNIKITDESLRVQVINVSTGEYEGNATITF